MDDSVSVFISYSHKDEAFRKELRAHLAALKDEGKVSEWNDHSIMGGEEWTRQSRGRWTKLTSFCCC